MASNNDSETDEANKITTQDILAFWEQKKIVAKCDLCSASDWSNLNAGEYKPAIIFQRFPGFASDGVSAPVAVLSCNNCGNLKFINKVHISQNNRTKGGQPGG